MSLGLSRQEAEQLTARIKDQLESLLPLIKYAYEGRIWEPLGYKDWYAYCDVELSGIRIPIETRREIVPELQKAGLSQRAIAAATNVARSTVQDDLKVAGIRPPAKSDGSSHRVVGLDGKSYPMVSKPKEKDSLTPEFVNLAKPAIEETKDKDYEVPHIDEAQVSHSMLELISDLVNHNNRGNALVSKWRNRDRYWPQEEWAIYQREVDAYLAIGDHLRDLANKSDGFDAEVQKLLEETM